MIYTVTINPSLDYIISVENFRIGVTNRTSSEHVYPGGKGINVSLMLKNLGIDSVVLGFTAGFTGNEIKRLLAGRNIKTDFIDVTSGTSRINVKLRSGEETEINGAGPKYTDADIKMLYEKLNHAEPGDYVVLAGSIPPSLPVDFYKNILAGFENRGIHFIVDATGSLLTKVLEYRPFFIKPNRHELEEIFNISIRDNTDVAEYAKRLRDMGAVNVLVSLAGDGAVLVSEEGKVYENTAPEGKVINSVGAGDSMVAGFLAGYLGSGNYEEAFYTGICAGSASAFSETFATYDEVRDLLSGFMAFTSGC